MSKNPQKLGYVHNADVRETIDKVKNHIEINENRYHTINVFEQEIQNVQESLNDQADNAIRKMNDISQKIKSYVNNLKNNSKLDFDLSEYTEYLESLDITAIQQEKYEKLKNFIKNRKPIEESIYKQDISPISNSDLNNSNQILTKNSLITVEFHKKANENTFAQIPYGLKGWEQSMIENRDNVLKIPINNNTKSFEFGLIYTQRFSCVKEKVLERYFAGKITLTGLLSNFDTYNKIPFDLKGVIYNADYDSSKVIGPKMLFKFVCDKEYIYIWLDKVEPYRMIPVLDKSKESSNNVVLNMIDISEANLGVGYNSTNLNDLYVSENNKLDLGEYIGVNYTVTLSLYDTTTFDSSNVKNTMEIVEFNDEFVESIVNNSKLRKNELEVKPSNVGYTQLIGYGLSQTLNHDTNIVPENTVHEYRNFDLINHDDSRIHKLPPMSNQVWNLIEPDKKIQTIVRPEAFRRCGVIDTDSDTDYWYVWLEEDLYYGISNTIPNISTPFLDNSLLLGKITATKPNIGIPMFGKVGGKRMYLSKYQDGMIKEHNHAMLTLSDRLQDHDPNVIGEEKYKAYTTFAAIINRMGGSTASGEYEASAMSEATGHSHFYDEYTGYWYVLGSSKKPDADLKLEWFRTKYLKAGSAEWLNVRKDLDTISTDILVPESSVFTGSRMATDHNGRFIAIRFKNVNQFVLVIYDNGDFTNPVLKKTISFCNNYSDKSNTSFDSPYYHTLQTDMKGNWFIIGWNNNASHNNRDRITPYWISTDNGENWIRSDIKNVANAYMMAIHPSEDKAIFTGFNYSSKYGISTPHPSAHLKIHPMNNDCTNSSYYGSKGKGIMRYPVDSERNNKSFPHYHVEIYSHIYSTENCEVMLQNSKFGTPNNTHCVNYYLTARYGKENVETTWATLGSNLLYDEINDFYYSGHGSSGILSFDYTHLTTHWFTINRLYKVSKYDYSVQLIKNEHAINGNNIVPYQSWDYTGDYDTNQRFRFGSSGSASSNKTRSHSLDGHYNYVSQRLQLSYFKYYNTNKTLYMRKNYSDICKVTNESTIPVTVTNSFNDLSRAVYIPKINKYLISTGDKFIAIIDSLDEDMTNVENDRVCIALKNEHGGNQKIQDVFPGSPFSMIYTDKTNDCIASLLYDDANDIVYAFSNRGVHMFRKVDFSRKTNKNDQNTYDNQNYKFVFYPMFQELKNDIDAGKPGSKSRWVEVGRLNFVYHLYHIWDKEQNKIIIPLGDTYEPGNTYILSEKARVGMTEEYDRKYWKGFMIFDTITHEMKFIAEAFKQPGDGEDIDYIDPVEFTCRSIDTIWGKDADGAYIISPKTGNIYSALDGWTRFEKRECDYKLTQVIYNEKRNSYITFVNNTPHEYAKNRFTKPQIREIPLIDIDYKIKPEINENIRKEIVTELRKIAQKTNSEVFFKIEITIKPGKLYEDRYLLFYEDGVFSPDEKNNMIIRYFIPDIVSGSKLTSATENNNKCFTDYDLVRGYNMRNLNKIFKKIPGMKDIKWSEKINMPLERMEKLMKMPTKIKLTIYPTSGKMYNIDYSVNKNNKYSNKIYFSEITENTNQY